MLKDQQPLNGIGDEHNELDRMRSKVNKVGMALGYHAFDLSNEQILVLGQKISEIEEFLSSNTEKSEFPAHLNRSALTLEYALQVSDCIQSLPINTRLHHLFHWRTQPLTNPAWTSLMLHSTVAQRREMGTILGHLMRSVLEDLDLKTTIDNFDINQIRGFSTTRRLFFNIAFQEMRIPMEVLEDKEVGPQEAILKTARKRRLPKHERGSRQIPMRFPDEKTRKARKIVGIEWELWQYADENHLLPQVSSLKILSSQELEEIVNYFTGKSRRKSRRWAAIFDKFSIAVARLT